MLYEGRPASRAACGLTAQPAGGETPGGKSEVQRMGKYKRIAVLCDLEHFWRNVIVDDTGLMQLGDCDGHTMKDLPQAVSWQALSTQCEGTAPRAEAT